MNLETIIAQTKELADNIAALTSSIKDQAEETKEKLWSAQDQLTAAIYNAKSVLKDLLEGSDEPKP